MDSQSDARARFAGLLGATTIDVSRREKRWLALGEDVVAFAADDADGWARLVAEARLLARWRATGVPVPHVLDEDAVRRVQVRERLHGLTGEVVEPLLFGGARPDARARLAEGAPLSAFGARLAASYGELAARIHASVPLVDADALALGRRARADLDAALAKLRDDVSVPASVIDAIVRALPWLSVPPPATAVIHGDLHFHNLCLADDGTISGVFDLDEAGVDAAETDFQYVHSLGPDFVAIAVRAYGRTLDMEAIRHAHLYSAITHILWHGPGTPRHASIVAWITAAIEALAS